MKHLTRRDAMKLIASGAVAGCVAPPATSDASASSATDDAALLIETVSPLGFPWRTRDPFLFCAYHNDVYPQGNPRMGPATPLTGRQLGRDFGRKDGWSMYHGEVVPGFPQHPHRGFETVTIVRRGLVDHSDSLGATARYGPGDVQWLTAGSGIQHAEMFPLIEESTSNPLNLFQIWLNLPRADKMVDPHFTMLWKEKIPRREERDPEGRLIEVTVIAGRYGNATPLPPPPDSWASAKDSDVAIWTIRMAPEAQWTLPAAKAGTSRTLYVASGSELQIGTRTIATAHSADLRPDAPVPMMAGSGGVELLLLQGRPLEEPVVHHGPFVMNTPEEIDRAIRDYHETGFGGWPWDNSDPVHSRQEGRFARHADGRTERPV